MGLDVDTFGIIMNGMIFMKNSKKIVTKIEDNTIEDNIVEDVINDNLVLPKFGIEMLKIAIKEQDNDVVQQIIESTQDYSENYMTIISLSIAELCDYYPDFVIKYISCTSIMLTPYYSNRFYNWWNFAAIIDYKWNTFGRVYYYSIWLFYTIFYICYSLASTLEQKSIPVFYFKLIFIISIILGSIFLIFEIRQCLWNYKCYFKDIWNLFVLLFFIILGYAQAFFIVLRSNSINDNNDPRNVATKYDFVNPDGTINNATTMIQDPDSNTNLFNWFPTSLLVVYKLLTSDSGSLSSFTYREHSVMTILLVTFTFFTVIYLMNLFIGLLNIAIDDYNKKEEFLLQKAKIIMEIELFYMLPRQRNNKKWFPDWIYYDIPITEIRKLINAIDNEQTVFNYPPVISKKLRELVVLTDNNKKQTKEIAQELNKLEKQVEQTKEEFTKQNVELKQQIKKLTKQNVELKQQIKNEHTKQNAEFKQRMENIMELLKRD
ncbi:hypothetical protein GLOIN_2v1842993 [Rhizophagus clarus]|uniref:Ion transport domain-containing protein n=1 Tax=Rhizophagus clarus TaxID=94130 RepID=A0A8H3QJZ5_9GLOM|nr:hypothetical protein GLOIN_2v1842993 [Rhizophagus clarus]